MSRSYPIIIELRHTAAVATGALLLVTGLSANRSQADIIQTATAEYDLGPTSAKKALDTVHGQGMIGRDILAEITGPSAIASVGRFGDVGMSARIFSGPTDGSALVKSNVQVSSDEFVNPAPFIQRATTSFVIDGGELDLIGSRNSTAEFFLELFRSDTIVFSADVLLASDARGVPRLTTSGADIGASLDATTGIVTIPLSFQTADLGTLSPGAEMSLFYIAEIDLRRGPGEGLEGSYSDPFHLSTHAALGDVTFLPVVSSVPEPSTLTLLCVGLAGLLLSRHWRATEKTICARLHG